MKMRKSYSLPGSPGKIFTSLPQVASCHWQHRWQHNVGEKNIRSKLCPPDHHLQLLPLPGIPPHL